MLLVAWFLLCVLSVPLAGGRLGALADLRVARAGWLSAALALQIVVVSGWPDDRWTGWRAAAHVGSYALVAVFLVSNRGLPGLWVVAAGTAMNVAAIAANGGVMPASPAAVRAAGLAAEPGRFQNSAVVARPQLAFLGDVFAWPAPLPLANVFSVGDVCIVVGAAMVLHQVCGSRLVPRSLRWSGGASGRAARAGS